MTFLTFLILVLPFFFHLHFIFKSPLIIYPESCFPFPSESTNGSFNIKTSSGYKFGCLAKIVNYMKVRFLSTAMTRNCSIVVIVIVIFIYNTKCVLYGIVNVFIFLNTVNNIFTVFFQHPLMRVDNQTNLVFNRILFRTYSAVRVLPREFV